MGVGSDTNNFGRLYVETQDHKDEYNNAKNVYVLGTSRLYGEFLQIDADSWNLQKDNGVFKVGYSIIDKDFPDSPLVTSEFQVKSMEG